MFFDGIGRGGEDTHRTDQIDHGLGHLIPNLPLRGVGQGLHSTDPSQETSAR